MFLAVSEPAAAAPKPISGKLSKPGYTVIALAPDGKAKSVRARQGRFTLRPRADRVTLHLRAANGTYAGPIVVGGRGRRVIVGVMAGARLGRIGVREGYARVSRALRRRWIDRRRAARAKRGVPIGAGVFGRVRSRRARGPDEDRDLDGVPDPLDIDDDGDLILDNLDRSTRARASQVDQPFDFSTNLTLGPDETVNANAGTLSTEQMDTALSSFGALLMRFPPGDSAELDCGGPGSSAGRPGGGGLVYCSRGGTGRVFEVGVEPSDREPFPDCCDPDGDGFGTLTGAPIPDGPERSSFVLMHGATTAQIGTGDVLIERVIRGGVETQLPVAVQYVFGSVPALVAYDDGQGNSATVPYPVPGPPPGGVCPPPGPPCSGPGTRENGFPVKAGPNGDVVVTLTFWRPQRRPIAGEGCLLATPPCEWIDIGRLNYTAGLGDVGLACRQKAFSEQDPNLVAPSAPINLMDDLDGGFTDLAADQPANPTNTFTYTLDLTECLATHRRSFNSGETRGFYFAGVTPSGHVDDARQDIFFKRQ